MVLTVGQGKRGCGIKGHRPAHQARYWEGFQSSSLFRSFVVPSRCSPNDYKKMDSWVKE